MSLCKCDLPKQVEHIGSWDGCPLEGGAHTQFFVEECKGCGGICGFPQSNFELALKDGTPETKKTLAEIISDSEDVEIEVVTMECEHGIPYTDCYEGCCVRHPGF